MKLEQEIGTNKWKSQVQKATVNILFTSNWLRDMTECVMKEFDLKSQHFNLLRIIKGRSPGTISPGEIKEVMLDKGRDVTRLVDKLVRKGFVSRQQCPSNRRSVEICMTEKGLEFTDMLSGKLAEAMDGRINLSEEEGRLLSELLDKLRG
ncbi:MAG: MarR family transcriptional regulator [Bacteroidota bacterium]